MTTLLGFDVGSSSIKGALIDAETGTLIGSATSPDTELPIRALQPGFAEQEPDVWWEHVIRASQSLSQRFPEAMKRVGAIGISYQMHGLVLVDRAYQAVRPSIIWCDSRAVQIGEDAFEKIGKRVCLEYLLNSPGNFTASKLRWVMENEPAVYGRTHFMMLPGDYIALKLTGEVTTTPSGLSEGIMWDFKSNTVGSTILSHYEIPSTLIPHIKPTFSPQGSVTKDAAGLLGVPAGIPVSYRAGDQPNNAYSLNVLNPGEFATTAGTSGVVYGVSDKPSYDSLSRVNTFLHVTHTNEASRLGTLLCCNGTGILYRWARDLFGGSSSYASLNEIAQSVPPGSEGLLVHPYGNGAERSLSNKNPGAAITNLYFNTHSRAHFIRAVQEGIVFSLQYGLEIMKEMGISVRTVRAGNANLFLSPLFREVFASVTGAVVELFDTDGAQGAARGAGVGAGIFKSHAEAFKSLRCLQRIEPNPSLVGVYKDTYNRWKVALSGLLKEKE